MNCILFTLFKHMKKLKYKIYALVNYLKNAPKLEPLENFYVFLLKIIY